MEYLDDYTRLKQSTIDDWNCWRQQPASRLVLLRGLVYVDADLRGADLHNAHLEGSTLIESDLCEADLKDACMVDVDLRLAHLEKADLTWACLAGADLRKAHLEGACLISADLSGADLRGAHLEGANLSYACLEQADLRGATLGQAELGAIFGQTILAQLDLSVARGLDTSEHRQPSVCELHTLQLSQNASTLHFLRNAGVPQPYIDAWQAIVKKDIQ